MNTRKFSESYFKKHPVIAETLSVLFMVKMKDSEGTEFFHFGLSKTTIKEDLKNCGYEYEECFSYVGPMLKNWRKYKEFIKSNRKFTYKPSKDGLINCYKDGEI